MATLLSGIGMLLCMSVVLVSVQSRHSSQLAQPQPDLTRERRSGTDSHARSTDADVAEQKWEHDVEQSKVLAEELQAITDRSLELSPEEMPAYWRLMSWVNEQPFEELQNHSAGGVTIGDLISRPSENRAKRIRLDLNVCRVLRYEVQPNPIDAKELFEVWGWTNESKSWLYVGVCSELPSEFPTGPKVSARATLCGYFFKVQGYHEAGSSPRATPLPAPLVIGRLQWQRPVQAASQPNRLPDKTSVFMGFGVGLGLLLLWLSVHRPKERQAAERQVSPEEWWEGVQQRRQLNAQVPDYTDSYSEADL